MSGDESSNLPPVTELKSRQRRVLGVLVEKAFTTPEYYPMTLKALTAGCNQKSNRDPVSRYSEDEVEETLDQLRELGLAAVVHTESGRTERFRHYMRKRFTLSEGQLAILTELLLRGRQQLGELRSRASRMVPIDGLDQLRDELRGLIDDNLVQANGALERRGIEVDHALYTDREPEKTALRDAPPPPKSEASPAPRHTPPTTSAPTAKAFHDLENLDRLRDENRDLREQIARLEESVESLRNDIGDLKRDLGA